MNCTTSTGVHIECITVVIQISREDTIKQKNWVYFVMCCIFQKLYMGIVVYCDFIGWKVAEFISQTKSTRK